MATQEFLPKDHPVPQVKINFVPAKAGETLKVGPFTVRIMEDGSHTGIYLHPLKKTLTNAPSTQDNRLGVAEFIVPAGTPGPPPHWHEMHDEGFFVTKGTIRFSTTGHKDAKDVDAKAGDYMAVPVRAPHTFNNPFDEEAKFICTFTPAFYVNYFKLLGDLTQDGRMTPQIGLKAMATYATLPVPGIGGPK